MAYRAGQPAAQFSNLFPQQLNYEIPSFDYGPGASQATALNLAGGENLSALTDRINALTRGGQAASLAARIPGAAGLEAESSANIGAELRGQIPADVLRQLQQQAAERGVATGSPGSPNANAAYLRALGLTSLDLTGRGESDLTAALARNPAAPIFDPSTQLITPYQGAALGLQGGSLGLNYEEMIMQDRLNRQRLAQSGMAGRGGGGGQPGLTVDPGAYARRPFASDYQTTFVSQSPYSGATGNILFNQDPTAAWLSSINYNPNFGAQPGTGRFFSSSVSPEAAAEETAYWDPANWAPQTATGTTAADTGYVSPEAVYGPEQ